MVLKIEVSSLQGLFNARLMRSFPAISLNAEYQDSAIK